MTLGVVLAIIMALSAPSIQSAEGGDNHVAQSQEVGAMSADPESWSGGFIDSEDEAEIVRWAHNMCRGIDIAAQAKVSRVDPTIHAVARAVIGNVSDNETIQRRAVEACEMELRRVGHD